MHAAVLWSHILEWEYREFERDDVFDYAGWFDGSSSTTKDKANLSLQWMWNDWSVAYLGEYINGQVAEVFFIPEYIQKIPSRMYHDLVASFTFGGLGGSTRLSAGITNLTDEAPPYIDTGFNASTDPSTYRLFGRCYYLRIKWAF